MSAFGKAAERDDPFEDPRVKAWAQRVERELVPMIRDSAVTMQIVSGTEPDVKIAVELGFMILLDKPIILAVLPGVQVPPKLMVVADAIVEFDEHDPDGTQRRLGEAVRRLGVDG